jgi:periplasmic divalent cation tolerance protein
VLWIRCLVVNFSSPLRWPIKPPLLSIEGESRELKMPEYIEVHSTTDSREEADRICAAVVEARLAACAQVTVPIRSTYWWKGRVEHADEYFIMMKTTRDRFRALAELIRENHSYETPDIVAVPILEGTEDYLNWISCETQEGAGSA